VTCPTLCNTCTCGQQHQAAALRDFLLDYHHFCATSPLDSPVHTVQTSLTLCHSAQPIFQVKSSTFTAHEFLILCIFNRRVCCSTQSTPLKLLLPLHGLHAAKGKESEHQQLDFNKKALHLTLGAWISLPVHEETVQHNVDTVRQSSLAITCIQGNIARKEKIADTSGRDGTMKEQENKHIKPFCSGH